MSGRHLLKTCSSTQSSVALSSGEAEFYGVVKASGYGLAYQALLGAIVLTPFALWAGLGGITPNLGLFAVIGVLQSLSHGLSIAAFRFAPAGILAPLVYLEIVAAVIVGFFAFGDWPETHTWIGIAIILSSGALVALNRE